MLVEPGATTLGTEGIDPEFTHQIAPRKPITIRKTVQEDDGWQFYMTASAFDELSEADIAEELRVQLFVVAFPAGDSHHVLVWRGRGEGDHILVPITATLNELRAEMDFWRGVESLQTHETEAIAAEFADVDMVNLITNVQFEIIAFLRRL